MSVLDWKCLSIREKKKATQISVVLRVYLTDSLLVYSKYYNTETMFNSATNLQEAGDPREEEESLSQLISQHNSCQKLSEQS